MKTVHSIGLALAAGLLALPSAALAHPKLLSTTPADKATVSNVTQASLTFSEKLVAPVSGVDLVMTAMPGTSGREPMKINGIKMSLGADGKTLVAKFPGALAAGSYRLDWHVVSTDTHRVKGSYAFTVR